MTYSRGSNNLPTLAGERHSANIEAALVASSADRKSNDRQSERSFKLFLVECLDDDDSAGLWEGDLSCDQSRMRITSLNSRVNEAIQGGNLSRLAL